MCAVASVQEGDDDEDGGEEEATYEGEGGEEGEPEEKPKSPKLAALLGVCAAGGQAGYVASCAWAEGMPRALYNNIQEPVCCGQLACTSA